MHKSYDQKGFVKRTDKRSKTRWILSEQSVPPSYLEVSFVKYDCQSRRVLSKKIFVVFKLFDLLHDLKFLFCEVYIG